MKLECVYLRFYRSFNYDYRRKTDSSVRDRPAWEWLDREANLWYPFVRVPIEPDVTTIAGANESGKSHLLSAIQAGLANEPLTTRDFCRYSPLYSIKIGQRRLPDLGFAFTDLTEGDRATFQRLSPEFAYSPIVYLFRLNGTHWQAYYTDADDAPAYNVTSEQLSAVLPEIHPLGSSVALPASVPIGRLLDSLPSSGAKLPTIDPQVKFAILDAVEDHANALRAPDVSQESVSALTAAVAAALKQQSPLTDKEVDLVRRLLFNVASVDPSVLTEMYDAVRAFDYGHLNNSTRLINRQLAAALNLSRWWTQDREFEIGITPHEGALAFTVRDRTAGEYALSERSKGLSFFLSYFIQYRSFVPPADRGAILLMDEPDAYLSASGQQDLVRVLRAFTERSAPSAPVQVVYVTHSPFLVDRNRGHTIRVVDKGTGDEGTRVVTDASRNHYEPLRSALGALVAETAFMGNVNLIVDGAADQILLAGATEFLTSRECPAIERLDLNRTTVVPAGGSSHIPYMVYLARGRGPDRPAVVVLLDSDSEGDEADKQLQRRIITRGMFDAKYIVRIRSLRSQASPALPGKLVETEDLIPLALCVEAARSYLRTFAGITDEASLSLLTMKRVKDHAANAKSVFKAIEAAANSIDPEWHIEKTGFARSVIDVLRGVDSEPPKTMAVALNQFETNMRALFAQLNSVLRAAQAAEREVRIDDQVARRVAAFLQDHPSSARREDAVVLLEDVGTILDQDRTPESAKLQAEIAAIRRDHKLNESLELSIDGYEDFANRLLGLKYVVYREAEHDSEQPAPAGP